MSEKPTAPRHPPCPHLPPPRPGLSWRELNRHGDRRDGPFYLSALTYANSLWCRGHSARAVLALNRGLYADLRGDEPELADWPLPYAAYRWFFENDPGDRFMGNPRISFQHQAGRIRGDRREQRVARAWACWHIARACLPDLPGDPKHIIEEPAPEDTYRALKQHGVPGESEHWKRCLEAAS